MVKYCAHIIDDDKSYREDLEDVLSELPSIDKVFTFGSYKDYSYALSQKTTSKDIGYIGIFDINLNPHITRNTDGIKCASALRKLNENAHIINYSGYQNLLEKAIEKGFADDVIIKGESAQETKVNFKASIIDYMVNQYENSKHTDHLALVLTEWGRIDHVNRENNTVTIDCYNLQGNYKRHHPISQFSSFGNEKLVVDTPIVLKIFEDRSSGALTSLIERCREEDVTRFEKIPEHLEKYSENEQPFNDEFFEMLSRNK